MSQRPRIPLNRDKDYDYAQSIIARGIYPKLGDFVKKLDAAAQHSGLISDAQANQVLADGMRMLVSDRINRFPPEHRELIAVMTMVESLAAMGESLADHFMKPEPERLIFKSGYRIWKDTGFVPDPQSVMDEHTISLEEKVLEALRDRFKDHEDMRVRQLMAAAYKRGAIGGQGTFFIAIKDGCDPAIPQNVSRQDFASLLNIPKEDIIRNSSGRDVLVLALPEQATLQALGISRPGLSGDDR